MITTLKVGRLQPVTHKLQDTTKNKKEFSSQSSRKGSPCPKDLLTKLFRSEKLQNESSPNFSNFRPEFCPEFCSEFSPNFSRIFRASFRGKRRPEKIHQKSPPFFNAKFPGEHEKNIHKHFLESRKSKSCGDLRDTVIVAHVSGDPLSRYTCRSRFPHQNPSLEGH